MFIAILWVAISVIFFGNLFLGLAILIFILIRIFFLKKPFFFAFAIVTGIIFTLLCVINIKQLDKNRLLPVNEQQLILKVQPDDFNILPDYYHGKAVIVGSNQSVLFSGTLSSNSPIPSSIEMDKPLLMNVKAEIKDLDSATNQNQFDAKRYYSVQGISNSIKIKSIIDIRKSDGFSLVDTVHSFRVGLINYANQLPKPLNLYVLSLIIGEMNSEVYDEITGIKQLGLIHLFSISGLHVYYFISMIERILIYLRFRRDHYQLLIMLVLPLYFIFSGSSVGLLRAILMVEAGLITKFFSFKMGGLDIWSIALIINLILAPRMLIQFGSQLSYALSFGLIFTNKFGFFKQTILMNMLSIPFVIFHVYEWHFLTFFANLFILPLFSIIIFPIVIIGMLCFTVVPMVAFWIANFLALFDGIINWIGNLPGNILFGKPPILLAALLFLFTVVLLGNASRKWWSILIVTYGVSFLLIHFPINGEVVYFDVGQGDSFLIRKPFNRSVDLIDTGGRLMFGKQAVQTKFNAEKTSINYLKSIGIDRINNLFITHQDADHSGDLPAFLSKMKIDNLIIPIGMQNNKNFMDKLNGKMNNTNLMLAKDGDTFDNHSLQIYHPFTSGMGANEDSLVIGSRINNLNWLFTGDLDQDGEKKIINKYPNLRADILKAGHHGSKTSTAIEFLNQIQPKLVIISAGRKNRYGHPHSEVVNQLQQRKIKIYNTQTDGMIAYRFGGFGYGHFETYMKR